MPEDDEPLGYHERRELIARLANQYSQATTVRARWFFLRKRYSWALVVNGAKLLKRVVDIAVALSALILLSPVLLLLAAIIKVTDPGPIFYISQRVGLWGQEFGFPKFRSMRVDADKIKEGLKEQNQHGNSEITFKMKDDPRISGIGKIMRRTSFDEMPQLWCVLKGQMSLVGPRPPLPEEVARYNLNERRRLDVLPGLTCLWQVKGRSDIPFDQQVQLDLEYIRSRSLWLDIKILFRTVPAVLLGKGAY